MKCSLCIHAHFYQPPRENPWFEAIELQKSAAPFSDWNERIHAECYRPNTRARVLDSKGEVVGIVNNFEKINFNVGPTLISWLEAMHPETYRAILEADKVSLKQCGHGNAIAQVYNHMILPLAAARDQKTQVRWGIEDFRSRFGREPESIWLAETGCNDDALEILIEAGMKYVILEPHQAEAIRPIGGTDWQDVSQGQIDPKKPYRFFSKKNEGKFIDIFFYDGPLSRAMSFQDLLLDAKNWLGSMDVACGEAGEAALLNMATDGETYGHHKKFADRVLAYTAFVEAPKRGYTVTNYAAFLEKHPPQSEVKIKGGEDGKGTAWSCSHGLRRWYDDCGCQGGALPGWNQQWRKPLREALDWLRDALIPHYEKNLGAYCPNVWEARDEYIQIILNRSEDKIEKFFQKHASRPLNQDEKVICLKWLEVQRHAMLMYTSCGWFFSEISGIETVQVIEYAARAIQLAEELMGQSFQEEFIKRLSKAKSNLPDFKDGGWIYQNLIQPKIVTLEKAAQFFAISAMFDPPAEGKIVPFHCFDIEVLHQRRESFGDLRIHFYHVKIASRITKEQKDLILMAVHIGLYDFRCSVKAFENQEQLDGIEAQFFEKLSSFHIVELFRKMDEIFGTNYIALKDAPLKGRMRILNLLTKEVVNRIDQTLEGICDENRQISDLYRSVDLPTPNEIQYAAEHTLKNRIQNALRQLAREGFNPRKTTALTKLIDAAASFQVQITGEEISPFLSRELERRTTGLMHELKEETLQACLSIEKIAKKLNIELDQNRAQEQIFFLIQEWVAEQQVPVFIREHSAPFLQLASYLKIHTDSLKKILQEKVNTNASNS